MSKEACKVVFSDDILKDYDITKLNFLRSSDLKIGEPKIIEEKTAIKKLVAHYLINEKINNKPLNPVSRFHLGNGASIYNIIINGNISDYGYKESFGIMVNLMVQIRVVRGRPNLNKLFV